MREGKNVEFIILLLMYYRGSDSTQDDASLSTTLRIVPAQERWYSGRRFALDDAALSTTLRFRRRYAFARFALSLSVLSDRAPARSH